MIFENCKECLAHGVIQNVEIGIEFGFPFQRKPIYSAFKLLLFQTNQQTCGDNMVWLKLA